MKFFSKIASLFMLAAAALTVSCSEIGSEESFDVPVDESRVISFSVKLPETTRGTGILNTTLTSFDIYATYSAYATVSKKVMSVSTSGIWTLDGAMAMPADGSVTFYAVGSIGESATSVSFDLTDKAIITYTMDSDVTAQPTVVMAAPYTLAEDATSLSVEFAFDHVLAAVGFKAGEGDYTLTKVEMSNFYAGVDIAFSDSYSTSSYTFGSKTTYTFESASVEDDGTSNFYMIPAQSMEGTTYKAYFSYYADGEEVATFTEEGTLLANLSLEILGMEYTYVVENKEYDAPEYITPDEDYDYSDTDGTYVLDDMVVGDNQEIDVESNSTLTWASSNESVATVDSSGEVSAVGGGTAIITATSANGEVEVEFEVTVWTPISGATVSPTTLSIKAGDTSSLTAGVSYAATANLESYTLSWATSSSTYATVSNGTVTGVAAGSATITVTATGAVSGYSYSATCVVTVTKAGFDYTALSKGTYIDKNGDITTSSSSAVAMVYYVDYTEGFALAVSTETYTRVYQWCSSAYTSTKISASSYTDGYSNTKTMKTRFGTTTSSVNPVAYTQSTYSSKLANLTNVYDGAGKGEFYMPSQNELYLMFTALYNKSGYTLTNITGVSFSSSSISTTGTVYKAFTAAGGPTFATFSNCCFVSSTETAATTHRGLSVSDVSGYTTEKYKSTLCYSLEDDAYSNSYEGNTKYYVIPIVKL